MRRACQPVPAAVVAAVAAVAVGLLTGCTGGSTAERASGGYIQGDYGITVLEPAERAPAPAVEGEDLDGAPISLADFAGQTVVVNIWGSWCTECRIETADLVQAERELRADDVAFLGIDIRDDRAAALAYEQDNDVTWPSIYDQDSSLLVGFREQMTVAATPTTFVVDDEGRLAARLLGPQSVETFVDVVDEVGMGSPDG